MSEPYAVLVQPEARSLSGVYAFGPMDEEEADAFAARLRREYDLKAEAIRLQGWTGAHESAARLRRAQSR
jgi:hypothetical protein